ncbi:MAG: tRNA (adenosine(37)-N6)-dimethylallyltransferase MiaA [Pseudomonadota bacterium]|nr:tRNA (adenosine(37)-N6)-dimethylallyltransferase MiaA [Pseudomonadota bacterium]
MGPTASGKTELAIRLAERFPLELISVDAAQVYRGMDIGTAKPEPELLRRYPHRLIDICDPAEAYSAARFREDARRAIGEIHAAGRLPLLVGGTMFYFAALEHGLSTLPRADPALRAEIEAEAARTSWPALHRELERIDPSLARTIRPEDAQRIQRALEIHRLTGEAPSAVMAGSRGNALPHPLIKMALFTADRSQLHDAIARRFRTMLEAGLLSEVERLMERGDLSLKLPALRTVGYRQAWEHLSGERSRDEMERRAIAATRQLAKRQLTWLRQQRGVVWLQADDQFVDAAVRYLESALQAVPSRNMI